MTFVLLHGGDAFGLVMFLLLLMAGVVVGVGFLLEPHVGKGGGKKGSPNKKTGGGE
ncbi:MAG TPA: hypothetical protein VF508_13240 [Pyrinomonadaceae bacterium]|jgi:hypothetical protein